MAKRQKAGGTRKYNRNRPKCERYRHEHRREKNKIRKLRRMIKRLSPDNNMRIQCEKRIKELERVIRRG